MKSRQLTSLVAVSIFISLIAPRAVAAPAKSYLPLTTGASWTYEVSRGKGVTMRATSFQGGRWTLSWSKADAPVLAWAPLEAEPMADGAVLYTKRAVGYAAKLQMVPLADLRWAGPETWKAKTFSGCMGTDLDGRREAVEQVTVPAGTFTCLKIVNRSNGEDDIYWFAQGTGIVKRVYGPASQRVEWRLASHRLGK